MMTAQIEGLFGMRLIEKPKQLGQFFTPTSIAKSLIEWVVRSHTDEVLDPSCGNGEFLRFHKRSTGVELSPDVCREAKERCPTAAVINTDFFNWAFRTDKRFEAVVGNPPFIRYQTFSASRRAVALELSRINGAHFSGLASSWAPFIVVAASLLKKNGRLGFVVPAEIGHATYSVPLIEFLVSNCAFVQVIAIRKKIFPKLSEDAWLLLADGYGGTTQEIAFSICSSFIESKTPPKPSKHIPVKDWRRNGCRLRKFLLPNTALDQYEELSTRDEVVTLGSIARTGIGYVTGGNSFFHLTPSEAATLRIPQKYLRVSVRNGGQLRDGRVDDEIVQNWLKEDREVLLIDLCNASSISPEIQSYLDSEEGLRVRNSFKCRVRKPWYAVPNVEVPDAFLTYMNGNFPMLVPNEAKCVCTNTLLAVRLKNGLSVKSLAKAWLHPLARLSQEIEGHPLGGGMLKLEPGEAARVRLPVNEIENLNFESLVEGVRLMREWRHSCDG